jgi:hypothetical protein
MTTDDEGPDGTGAESPTAAEQGGGSGSANPEPGQASRVGDHESGEFDAGDFVVDHDVDPPEEVQPTTTA